MLIVNYHNVLAHSPSALNARLRKEWDTQAEFDRQIAELAARFEIVPLQSIVTAIQNGEQLDGVCAITFDDGCFGAYQYGKPVLERYRATATFFIITQRVRGTPAACPGYFDRLEALLALTTQACLDLSDFDFGAFSLQEDEDKLAFYKIFRRRIKVTPAEMKARIDASLHEQLKVSAAMLADYLRHEAYQTMSWEEIEDLQRNGHEIGGHTRTHPPLSQIAATELDSEIHGCHADLQERLGARAFPFAYPFGKPKHISEAAVAAVQSAGFSCAVTMKEGGNTATTNLFKLRRISFEALEKGEAGLAQN
ncbi:polysaccharide deacetylase family protein [candidate division KSB1 bacterium]|nr:polysaccharide deacetylase family protein [candidate division KSB1 bacterium]